MSDQQALKFKKLVEVCLETKNYVKIAAITLAMIKNEVNSHAVTYDLSVNPDASIQEMMAHTNTILKVKFGISPYNESMITQIKLIENLMEKGKGNIPIRFIKDAIAIYFEMRQISLLPFKSVGNPASNIFSKRLFSRNNKSNDESLIQQLINNELSSRETVLRSRIESGRDDNALGELQKISILKESLTANKKKKIGLNDSSMTQDQRYFLFFAQSKAYPLLGMFFMLFFLSLLILTQMILNLELLAPLGSFFLMFAAASAISLYLYGLTKKKVITNPW